LDNKDVTNIKGKDLKEKISLVNEIKIMEVEVEWLRTRLTEILEARQILKQSGKLKEKFDSNKESIEIAESALRECETAKKKLKAICDKETLWKERLARSQHESTKTYQEIKSAKSRVKQFLNCSLVDDLL
jgi:ribosomal protein S21